MLRNRVGNPIQNSNFPTLSGLTLYGLLQVTRRMFWSSAAKLDQHRTIKAVKPIWQPRNLHLHQKPAILKCDLSVNKIFDMNLYLPKILFLFRGHSVLSKSKRRGFSPNFFCNSNKTWFFQYYRYYFIWIGLLLLLHSHNLDFGFFYIPLVSPSYAPISKYNF